MYRTQVRGSIDYAEKTCTYALNSIYVNGEVRHEFVNFACSEVPSQG